MDQLANLGGRQSARGFIPAQQEEGEQIKGCTSSLPEQNGEGSDRGLAQHETSASRKITDRQIEHHDPQAGDGEQCADPTQGKALYILQEVWGQGLGQVGGKHSQKNGAQIQHVGPVEQPPVSGFAGFNSFDRLRFDQQDHDCGEGKYPGRQVIGLAQAEAVADQTA